MQTTLTIGLILLLNVWTVFTCLDVLFVLDPVSELSRPRATKIANDLAKRDGIRTSVAVQRLEGRYTFMATKSSADLIASLDNVGGSYDRYLSMVTAEIVRRKVARPFVVLLFSETPVNTTMVSTWKDVSKDRNVHIFRIGNAKPENELSTDDRESFENIIACGKASKLMRDIRRRPVISSSQSVASTTTFRPRIVPFSKTTRPPTTTRAVTVSGPKLRPVFRHKDKNVELDKLTAHEPIVTANPVEITVTRPSFRLLQNRYTVTSSLIFRGRSTVSPRRQEAAPFTPQPRSIALKTSRLEAVTPPFFHHNLDPITKPITKPFTRPLHVALHQNINPLVDPVQHNIRFLTTIRGGTRTITTTARTTTVRTPPGCVVDIIFLMDFSDGTGDKSKRYLDIAAAAVGRFPISQNAVRVSIVRYSGPGRAETLFHLDKHSSKDELIEEMFHMQPTGGTTRTGEAIQYAIKEFGNRKHGARKHARKFIVVFTDGYSQEDPSPAAESARIEGITMLAVAIDDKFRPNREELAEITANRGMILVSPNGQELRDKILGSQCSI